MPRPGIKLKAELGKTGTFEGRSANWATRKWYNNIILGHNSPRKSSALHVVGECDVIGPDVELPLPESEDAAVNPAGVNPDPHVDVDPGHLPDQPEMSKCQMFSSKRIG